MIQSDGLRIGNWVSSCLHDDLQTEIFSVLDSKTVRLACNPLAIYKNEDINPIPLTEESLLNFGFEKIDNIRYRFEDRLIIFRDGYFCDYGTGVVLMYVHKLQNLYFEIKGKGLDYDPNR